MNKKVIICGDLHGDWASLNTLINHKKPDIIIQCGDFGWWPHYQPKNQFGIKNEDTKIFWLPGNHENWEDLKCLTDYVPYEIQDNLTYCPFGTVIEVGGYNILMCGGAESIDKKYRVEGVSWWKNEIISQEDMDNLPECEIDVVCSHTAPRNWIRAVNWGWILEDKDPSTFALQLIFEKYRPKKWFSAHFHHYLSCNVDDCEWVSLSCPGEGTKWWAELFNDVDKDIGGIV